MSKATQAAARADAYFGQYLAIGPERSVKKLAAHLWQTVGDTGRPSVPTERTLEAWSSVYGWDRRAKAHDREVIAKERELTLKKNASMAQERQDVALENAMAFHALVHEFLTIKTPRMDPKNPSQQMFGVASDGGQIPLFECRPVDPREISRADLRIARCLHESATDTVRVYLGGSKDAYEQYREQQGKDCPDCTPATREEIMDESIFLRLSPKDPGGR